MHPPTTPARFSRLVIAFTLADCSDYLATDFLRLREQPEQGGREAEDEEMANATNPCSFVGCCMADCWRDVGLRACSGENCNNQHHHVCAITSGQESMQTLCSMCWAAVSDLEGELASDPVPGSPAATELDDSPALDEDQATEQYVVDSSDGISDDNDNDKDEDEDKAGSVPVPGSPAARLLFGSAVGSVHDVPHDNSCFFHSFFAALELKLLNSESHKKLEEFVGDDVPTMRKAISKIIKGDIGGIMAKTFDYRIGNPPPTPGDNDWIPTFAEIVRSPILLALLLPRAALSAGHAPEGQHTPHMYVSTQEGLASCTPLSLLHRSRQHKSIRRPMSTHVFWCRSTFGEVRLKLALLLHLPRSSFSSARSDVMHRRPRAAWHLSHDCSFVTLMLQRLPCWGLTISYA
jgi:hypothetical protein